MTSARRAAWWCASRPGSVDAWSSCVRRVPALTSMRGMAALKMPRPRCSIAVVAGTRVGVGGGSVVGGGGCRVPAERQQARCHQASPASRAPSTRASVKGPRPSKAPRTITFSTVPPPPACRTPHSLINSIRVSAPVMQRSHPTDFLCAPARKLRFVEAGFTPAGDAHAPSLDEGRARSARERNQ